MFLIKKRRSADVQYLLILWLEVRSPESCNDFLDSSLFNLRKFLFRIVPESHFLNHTSSVDGVWSWLYSSGGPEELWTWIFICLSWNFQYVLKGILFSRLLESFCGSCFKNVGEKSLVKNYHLVSLFSVVSKIFKKFVSNRLADHLEKYSLSSDFPPWFQIFSFNWRASDSYILQNCYGC